MAKIAKAERIRLANFSNIFFSITLLTTAGIRVFDRSIACMREQELPDGRKFAELVDEAIRRGEFALRKILPTDIVPEIDLKEVPRDKRSAYEAWLFLTEFFDSEISLASMQDKAHDLAQAFPDWKSRVLEQSSNLLLKEAVSKLSLSELVNVAQSEFKRYAFLNKSLQVGMIDYWQSVVNVARLASSSSTQEINT